MAVNDQNQMLLESRLCSYHNHSALNAKTPLWRPVPCQWLCLWI